MDGNAYGVAMRRLPDWTVFFGALAVELVALVAIWRCAGPSLFVVVYASGIAAVIVIGLAMHAFPRRFK